MATEGGGLRENMVLWEPRGIRRKRSIVLNAKISSSKNEHWHMDVIQLHWVLVVRESFPRQVDKKSRGPQGKRGLEFSRRKKGQTFFSSTFLRII